MGSILSCGSFTLAGRSTLALTRYSFEAHLPASSPAGPVSLGPATDPVAYDPVATEPVATDPVTTDPMAAHINNI
jgi:hypothetical protein